MAISFWFFVWWLVHQILRCSSSMWQYDSVFVVSPNWSSMMFYAQNSPAGLYKYHHQQEKKQNHHKMPTKTNSKTKTNTKNPSKNTPKSITSPTSAPIPETISADPRKLQYLQTSAPVDEKKGHPQTKEKKCLSSHIPHQTNINVDFIVFYMILCHAILSWFCSLSETSVASTKTRHCDWPLAVAIIVLHHYADYAATPRIRNNQDV